MCTYAWQNPVAIGAVAHVRQSPKFVAALPGIAGMATEARAVS